jgi:hypothetical protein
MGWASWISAAGGGIEVVGFWILARELRNSNTSAIMETAELRAETSHFDGLAVRDGDGDTAGGFFEGGAIGKLISNLNRRQAELTASKALIVKGLWWTGAGVVVQTIGSIGQAIWP